MLKFIVFCSLTLASLSSFASPEDQLISVKDRLRISLWMEGIEQEKRLQPKMVQPKIELPEEIERPLRKL